MTKNNIQYLLLCPHKGWLKDLGLSLELSQKTLVVMPRSARQASPLTEEEENLGGVLEVKDYTNDEEVISLSKHQAQKFAFQKIIAPDEEDILRAALLREDLGLEGQSWESALAFRDKVRMKEVLAQQGLKVPSFQGVSSFEDLLAFSQKEGFPLVLKPRQATGCRGLKILSSEEDVHEAKSLLEESPPDFYQVETFVQGKMYHVDGLVKGGKVIAAWPALYFDPPLNMLLGQPASSYLLSSENPLTPFFIHYAENVLHAMDTPETTAFHLEFFMPEAKGEPVFCEIASRVGGKGVNQSWITSFGIDLKKAFSHMLYGLDLPAFSMPPSPFILTGEIWFPCPSGKVENVPTECPFLWVKRWEVCVQNGDLLTPEKSIDHTLGGSSWIEAHNEEEMEARLKTFARWFKEEVRISEGEKKAS